MGICIHELKRKNSCTHGIKCNFSHEIPSSLRGNTELISTVAEKMNSKKGNLSSRSKPVCFHEFMWGRNSCTSNDCRKQKEHNLDTKKIKRGICLYEFFKKGSCSRNAQCHFTHQIPTECLSDPAIVRTVLQSINKYNNKAKIEDVLGNEVIQSALNLTPQNTQPTDVETNPVAHQQTTSDPPIPDYNRIVTNGIPYQQVQSQQAWSPNNPAQVQYNNSTNPVPAQVFSPESLKPFLTNIVKELISKEIQQPPQFPMRSTQPQTLYA